MVWHPNIRRVDFRFESREYRLRMSGWRCRGEPPMQPGCGCGGCYVRSVVYGQQVPGYGWRSWAGRHGRHLWKRGKRGAQVRAARKEATARLTRYLLSVSLDAAAECDKHNCWAAAAVVRKAWGEKVARTAKTMQSIEEAWIWATVYAGEPPANTLRCELARMLVIVADRGVGSPTIGMRRLQKIVDKWWSASELVTEWKKWVTIQAADRRRKEERMKERRIARMIEAERKRMEAEPS